MVKKAIIIGAGPAGLTTAYKLLTETDIKPIILEKENFVGGISRTAVHNGNRIDVGGHRFFSKNSEIIDLWKSLMPIQGFSSKDDILINRMVDINPGGPDPELDDVVFLNRNRVSRILYKGKFYDYPISLKLDTITNMGLIKTSFAGISYIWSQMVKREENNLEDFMINRFGKVLYLDFFKDYTHKVWGREPKDISAEWGAQRIKGLSLTEAVIHMIRSLLPANSNENVETSLIESFIYPKYGPGQYWSVLADEVVKLGGEIIYNTEVNSLVLEDGRITRICTGSSDNLREFRGEYFLSTMPINELINSIEGLVPDALQELANELPFRDFITVGLLVDKLNIVNTTKVKTFKNRIPDCWIYVQEPFVKVGRLQIFNNWSPYLIKDYENTIWIGMEYFCNEDDELWNMKEEDLIELAINEAVSIGLLNKNDILDTYQLKVKKAYPAYFGSYERFDEIKDYLNTISNLYCIGRNGQHRYNNMDHSMLTGFEAVRLIKNNVTDKSSLWEVNAESEYHEEKKT